MSELNYTFSIPIGDWSSDGHGVCQDHHYKSSYPVERLRDAYFQSKSEHPGVCPELFCSRYKEYQLDAQSAALIKQELGVEIEDFPPEGCDPEDRDYCVTPTDMLNITISFIKLSLPDWKVEPIEKPPMLPFYGFDERKRHIGFIGYGVFQ